jgi:poly(3-hydroxyalkanoate) synthetase
VGLDDYIAAAERAVEAVKKIAHTDQLNMLGLCAGGITVSYVLAHLAAVGDDSVKSVVYPADSTRYDRWYGRPTPTDPDEWLETATVEHGSWWGPGPNG